MSYFNLGFVSPEGEKRDWPVFMYKYFIGCIVVYKKYITINIFVYFEYNDKLIKKVEWFDSLISYFGLIDINYR